jgi:hypothetical protein
MESPPDAGDSDEHFQSHELGDKGYLEHFKFDAGSTAPSSATRWRRRKSVKQHYAF